MLKLSAFESLIPVVTFLALSGPLGVVAAVLAATFCSIALIARRWRQDGRVGLLLPLSLAYVIARGVLGVLTGSASFYFGAEVILDMALAVGALISVPLGRPLSAVAAPEVLAFSDGVAASDIYRRTMARITLTWGALRLVQLSWELWLLATVSPAQYFLTKAIVAWPLNGLFWVGALALLRRRLSDIEPQLDRPFLQVLRSLVTPIPS